MKLREVQYLRLKWLLTILLIAVSVYLGFKYLLPLLLPFVVAYFLAWLIRPVTELLYKKLKIPRIIGGSFSLLLLVAVFGTGLFMLINILIKQAIAFIRNLPVYINAMSGKLDALCGYGDDIFGMEDGTLMKLVEVNLTQTVNKVKSNLMPRLTERTISITVMTVGFIGIILIIFVSTVLIVKDLPEFQKRYANNGFYRDFHKVSNKLSEAGSAYLRSQFIIMAIVAVICVFGLSLIKNEYAVLLGMGIAIMDALPILGSGIVYIPWAIIMLMQGKIYEAAVLITIYLLCQVVREVLEPKLIGNRIGIKPLFTLISMYVGVKLFSLAGFFLGPIGLLIIITVYKVINEKSAAVASADDISYNED